jgi:hypothetical protein
LSFTDGARARAAKNRTCPRLIHDRGDHDYALLGKREFGILIEDATRKKRSTLRISTQCVVRLKGVCVWKARSHIELVDEA